MSAPQKSSEQLPDPEFDRLISSLGDDALLTRQEAAKFLRQSVRTIDQWSSNFRERRRRPRSSAGQRTGRERLSFIKMGHKVLFMLSDLRAFRDARKVAA